MATYPTEFAHTITTTFEKEGGAKWLGRLSELVAECEQRWSLTVHPPVHRLSFNYVAPATRADGAELMLKLGVPCRELQTEIDALRVFDGRGSARLLAFDRELGALLLERVVPGEPLNRLPDDEEATRIAARVMKRLWRPNPDGQVFPTVFDWAKGMERMRAHFGGGTGPFPRRLVDKAESLHAELLTSMDESVVLHGDLHHENILSAEREPWLAIDPKGVVGEPAYEVGQLLLNVTDEQVASCDVGRLTARRVDVLAEELGFDRLRVAGWGLARGVLSAWWCIEDGSDCFDWAIGMAMVLDEVMG
ncbi:MAG: phosphotransferase [Chloroflexi bacterium]|nr:phosphotransferase [Chloroflexota bacterium]